MFGRSGVPGVGPGGHETHGPGSSVLTGGADGPGRVGWKVGDRDSLDSTSQRISKYDEL